MADWSEIEFIFPFNLTKEQCASIVEIFRTANHEGGVEEAKALRVGAPGIQQFVTECSHGGWAVADALRNKRIPFQRKSPADRASDALHGIYLGEGDEISVPMNANGDYVAVVGLENDEFVMSPISKDVYREFYRRLKVFTGNA